MEMQVETFEELEQVTDVDGTVSIEDSEAALALINQLGLEGQQRLQTPSDGGKTTERMPYRQMSKVELDVYQVICPSKVKLSDYSAGPIPLRVLQVAAHADGMFEELEVWSTSSPVVKDPILVGVRTGPGRSWDKRRFLLARWGAELAPFGELLTKAAKVLREKYRATAMKGKRQIEVYLETLDSTADETLVGLSEPSIYNVS